MSKFKPGDVVRKRDGSCFSNGKSTATAKAPPTHSRAWRESSRTWLKETGTWIEDSDLLRINPSIEYGDWVIAEEGQEVFPTDAQIATFEDKVVAYRVPKVDLGEKFKENMMEYLSSQFSQDFEGWEGRFLILKRKFLEWQIEK